MQGPVEVQTAAYERQRGPGRRCSKPFRRRLSSRAFRRFVSCQIPSQMSSAVIFRFLSDSEHANDNCWGHRRRSAIHRSGNTGLSDVSTESDPEHAHHTRPRLHICITASRAGYSRARLVHGIQHLELIRAALPIHSDSWTSPRGRK